MKKAVMYMTQPRLLSIIVFGSSCANLGIAPARAQGGDQLRVYIQQTGVSPLDVPTQGVTIEAVGGQVISLDIYIEDAPSDQRLLATHVMMPCRAIGGDQGTVNFNGNFFVDSARPDFLFFGPRYCDAGTNIGMPCTGDGDCPGAVGDHCDVVVASIFADPGDCNDVPPPDPPSADGNPRIALTSLTTLPQGVVVTGPRYVGTFNYQVSNDARGEFLIELPGDPGVHFRDPEIDPIPFTTFNATLIVPTGQCCLQGSCLGVMTEFQCETVGGSFRSNTTCESDDDDDGTTNCADICEGFDDNLDADGNGIPDCLNSQIPTVSEWGMIVMALMLLTAGKLKWGGDRVRSL